jgi:hypothetical protein
MNGLQITLPVGDESLPMRIEGIVRAGYISPAAAAEETQRLVSDLQQAVVRHQGSAGFLTLGLEDDDE